MHFNGLHMPQAFFGSHLSFMVVDVPKTHTVQILVHISRTCAHRAKLTGSPNSELSTVTYHCVLPTHLRTSDAEHTHTCHNCFFRRSSFHVWQFPCGVINQAKFAAHSRDMCAYHFTCLHIGMMYSRVCVSVPGEMRECTCVHAHASRTNECMRRRASNNRNSLSRTHSLPFSASTLQHFHWWCFLSLALALRRKEKQHGQ